MDAWRSLGTAEQERAIGREKFTDLELDDDAKAANAHNVSSKFIVDGEENKIVRMNVPFSDPAAGITGTYFIGYSARWSVTKGMITNMVAKKDYLLTFSHVLFGQVFFPLERGQLSFRVKLLSPALARGKTGEGAS